MSGQFYIAGKPSQRAIVSCTQILFRIDKRANILDKHRDGDRVEAALGYNHVGILLRRLDKLLVHRFDGIGILLDDRLHGTAAVADVAEDTACQTQIGIGIYINLYIHQIAQLLVFEYQYTVDDNDSRRFDEHALVGAVMVDERIYGMLYRDIVLQSAYMLDEHVGIECLRVVVIEARTLIVCQLGVRLVVVIVAQRSHIIADECLLQTLYKRAFTRSGAAGDTNYGYLHSPINKGCICFDVCLATDKPPKARHPTDRKRRYMKKRIIPYGTILR